ARTESAERCIERKPDAQLPGTAVSRGIDGNVERLQAHKFRRDSQHDRAFAEALANEPILAAFEIAQAAVDEFARTARRAVTRLALPQQQRRMPRGRNGLRNARTVDAAADNDYVKNECVPLPPLRRLDTTKFAQHGTDDHRFDVRGTTRR